MHEHEVDQEQGHPSSLQQAWLAGQVVIGATAGLVGSLEALSAESVGEVMFGSGLIVAGSAIAAKALEECGLVPNLLKTKR